MLTIKLYLSDPNAPELQEVALGDGELLKRLFNSPVIQAIIAALLKRYLGI